MKNVEKDGCHAKFIGSVIKHILNYLEYFLAELF